MENEFTQMDLISNRIGRSSNTIIFATHDCSGKSEEKSLASSSSKKGREEMSY